MIIAPEFQMKKLRNCARCQGYHEVLDVFKLNNPPDDYGYFSICPDTQQPILVKKVDNTKKTTVISDETN